MDRLIDLQDARLLALEQEFEVELKTLQRVRREGERGGGGDEERGTCLCLF